MTANTQAGSALAPSALTSALPASATVPWHKRLKGRPGWVALSLIVIVALVIGGLRSSGPLTDDDRADSIAQRLACPVCDGESVYESQSTAAIGIRSQIKTMIQQGTYSDDQIIDFMETKFDAKTQLVPKGTGLEALVWALPVFGLVCTIAGLTVAFRRWKTAADTVPTNEDRALVAAAMRQQSEDA